ncbi:MAG: formate--tetrahydrofolate ligase [Candidatus Cloacimonadaceae bacterium]|jgi:formate--tetrahydrofolate ligase|nr:formate--tetrahydrofolate ligase [Candidatus Cloacimonadota bacterium]MCB5255583.1 formate--tetrahydrofolate ligase [Candidatus Cloacimonadota bacterium]MCK9177411.1 formate--tetrahydrofolate ligase [Candidatus Cloacimonadota bacterium]MCK9241689.1 formate--tetrahydrofolate ligase [Candidatus Cloacimonadota bacterium]MDY0126690.1 formate--tetrahydrofolate ligase [Candidatus Cloacimonadaceae bacterium]
MLSDIEIGHLTKLKHIDEIAGKIGLSPQDLDHYGEYKAKIRYSTLFASENNPTGKLILVSAITPTPAGEGKTTVAIGLSQAINRIGKKSIVAVREPSLGPVFGIKGGAAGGGWSQVLPMEDINLHFTGDFHAITAANNTLAALVDNHIYFDNELGIDPRRITWKRVLDVNDRMLRDVVIGLGGRKQGFPREDGFDITAASEIMAILCLSNNMDELKERIGNITVGISYSGAPVKVHQLGYEGAIAALLKDALKPNIVQTTENTPAFVHGGPFANIAQGANSILATKTAMRLCDYTVTEAGFGFDLGAEKFFDLVCKYGGFCVNVVVLVATVRALKIHGGVKVRNLSEPNPQAVKDGLVNLAKHMENIEKFGMKSVVAINKFPTDTEEELKIVEDFVRNAGVEVSTVEYFAKGSEGGLELAEKIVKLADADVCTSHGLYDWDSPVKDKIFTIASEIYGAEAVDYTLDAKADLKKINQYGFDKLPICIAKTQKSLSDNPNLIGRPKDFLVTVREIVIASGAGFLIPITGEIMRMPGLPKKPSAEAVDVGHDGDITGLL